MDKQKNSFSALIVDACKNLLNPSLKSVHSAIAGNVRVESRHIHTIELYVTGFAKTLNNPARTDILIMT